MKPKGNGSTMWEVTSGSLGRGSASGMAALGITVALISTVLGGCSGEAIGATRHVDDGESDGGAGAGGVSSGGGAGGTASGGVSSGGVSSGGVSSGGVSSGGGAGGIASGGTASGGTASGGAGGAPCSSCQIRLSTTQSNALHTLSGLPLTVTATLDGHTVFGLGTAGAGRIAVSGDGNVVYRESTCPLWQWLGASGSALPRVLCIGAKWPCDGETDSGLEINALHRYGGKLEYGGHALPPEYDANSAALRTDYDVVVYMGIADLATQTWAANPEDALTLDAFVRDHGGGLYLVSEYSGATTGIELTSLNAIALRFAVEFEDLNLGWGNAGAEAALSCLSPDPGGEIR